MTSRDDDRTGRRVRIATGVAGLATVLAGGAYLAAGSPDTPAAIGPRTAAASSAAASPSADGTGQVQSVQSMPQQNTAPLDSVEQTQRGSLKSGGIIRVVSARGDLSGQRELRWVAGGVKPYRNADCTQRFQLGNKPKPAVKPNLLLCWKTSTMKSVAVVLVDPDGKPSKARAVRELNKKWRSMG